MLLASLIVIGIGAVAAGLYALVRMAWIFRLPVENEKLRKIGGFVADGAMAFLFKMYQVLFPVVILGAIFIWIANRGPLQAMAFTFVAGAGFSALAGFLGMKTATAANMRTTHAAQTSLGDALKVAFGGASVTGMAVLSLALLGVMGVLAAGYAVWGSGLESLRSGAIPLVIGFSLGASAFALFARVGGGIFTKAADVGADLVGKIEAGIPEDDHRNPAVIADNVGDNVGDLAGMAADLFSSFVAALTAALVLSLAIPTSPDVAWQLATLPLVLGTLGVLASAAGIAVVRIGKNQNVQGAINRGGWVAVAVVAATGALVFPLWLSAPGINVWGLFGAMVTGLLAGSIIGSVTEHFTAQNRGPVEAIVQASNTGPATNIIAGMGQGLMSNFPILLTVFLVMVTANSLAGLVGVSLAALGMLLPMGYHMAVSAYGPIADNAGGLAEMSELPRIVRENTDKLDAVGNTTSAIGKGFAIGSTAMTAAVLFAAFQSSSGIQQVIPLLDIRVLAGLLIGGMIPSIFASQNMTAVGKAAYAMIEEVRRQFREKPGILDETEEPDYKACVSIATGAALQQMVGPGLVAVLAPIIAGYAGGIPLLVGLLCGAMVSGVVLAFFMTNTGGAWDNAKKTLEAKGAKGTDAHKAAVVGDTVGDPFKDTAGPSLNILIKLMAMVALMLAPALKLHWGF